MGVVKQFFRLQADVEIARNEMMLGAPLARLLRKLDVPDGEGRPVILLPGFGANEALLRRLQSFLQDCGYVVRIFVPGFPKSQPLGEFIKEISKPLGELIRELHAETGASVSLVGQSAGGLYAREYARHNPRLVDRVITLGSPTFSPENRHLQNQALTMLVEKSFGTRAEDAFLEARIEHWDAEHPDIPYVAVFSPVDGAVCPETVIVPEAKVCDDDEGPVRENVSAYASHFGMVLNPMVMLVVADRLAADASDWEAFDPTRYVSMPFKGLSKRLFPRLKPGQYEIADADATRGANAPVDPQERVMNTLLQDHENILRLTATIRDELAGESPNYSVVANIFDYLATHTDSYHHPREDLMCRQMLRRNPGLQSLMDALLTEHRALEREASLIKAAIRRHVAKQNATRNARLDARCRKYADALENHLRREEVEVFSHATVLTGRDWRMVERGVAFESDPLFGYEVVDRYVDLAERLVDTVEDVSQSAALYNVSSLGATASSIETLEGGFVGLMRMQRQQFTDLFDSQRALVKDAVDRRSVTAMATLPARLAHSNMKLAGKKVGAMAKEIGRVASDLLAPWKTASAGTEANRG